MKVTNFSVTQPLPNMNCFKDHWLIILLFLQVPSIDTESQDGQKPAAVSGNVEFRDVKFKYPARPEVQVRNVFPSFARFIFTMNPYQTSILVYIVFHS